MLQRRTYQPKGKEVIRKWHLIDAETEVLGRLSTRIVGLLMGKGKVTYSAHLDSGDYVVVVNAAKVRVTGNKEKGKIYYRHSGYPGGFREQTLSELRARNPIKIIEKAVFNMLPKNRLRSDRMARLKLFAGAEHKYADKVK